MMASLPTMTCSGESIVLVQPWVEKSMYTHWAETVTDLLEAIACRKFDDDLRCLLVEVAAIATKCQHLALDLAAKGIEGGLHPAAMQLMFGRVFSIAA